MAEKAYPNPPPPMDACRPIAPWALRPTAPKVRLSCRPSFRVREGRGPAGQGFQKVCVGNIRAVPDQCPQH